MAARPARSACERAQRRLAVAGDGVDLDPVAGAEQRRLADPGQGGHRAQHRLVQLVGDRQLLAHRHRRGPVRQPEHDDVNR